MSSSTAESTTSPTPATPLVAAHHGHAARRATVWLTVVSVFWGGTFLWMAIGTESLRTVLGPDAHLSSATLFLCCRYVLAAVLMPVVLPASVRRLDRAAWRYGFWVSIPFSVGMMLQVFGLTQPDLPPGQSAFVTSLYVVVTPILAAALQKKLPPVGVLVGIPLAAFGAAFIQGVPTGGLSIGAWATIASSVAFSAQIVLTDRVSRRTDPLALTFTMIVWTLPWTLATLLVSPGGLATLRPATLAAALPLPAFVLTLLACALPATVIALAVLNRWQKELHPSRAAIVYTSEPVFASAMSVAVGRDPVTGWLLVGAVSILLANLAAAFIARPEERS